MAASKYDFEPLLPPGRHYLDMNSVYELCVEPFSGPSKVCRIDLFQRAEQFVQSLLVLKVPCQIFWDGSFFTTKPEPDDVDMVVSIDEDVFDGMGPYEKNFTIGLNANEEIPKLDVTVWVCYKRGSKHYGDWSDPNLVASGYGLEHSERWAKGYGVLRLHETNVGLRICR